MSLRTEATSQPQPQFVLLLATALLVEDNPEGRSFKLRDGGGKLITKRPHANRYRPTFLFKEELPHPNACGSTLSQHDNVSAFSGRLLPHAEMDSFMVDPHWG